jgi:ribosomal protein S18 acetylase RimI-like enzyme
MTKNYSLPARNYICTVSTHLNNPVFYALSGRDKHLGTGTDHVKYFDEEVSPFASFKEDYENGFDDLYDLLPPKRGILYANPKRIEIPLNWKVLMDIRGIQMIHNRRIPANLPDVNIVPLTNEHIDEMVALATLTKPGPFASRTIEFGYYHGIFENGKLAAMTGQRMHVDQYNEISAVCTHPDHLGKSYATALTQHQVNLIYDQGYTPFLHVREDNTRAIKVYERLGFTVSRPMNFYFLRK